MEASTSNTLPHSLRALGAGFTIITGGAPGADTWAEKYAKERGMHVESKLCPHHPRVSLANPSITRQDLLRVANNVVTAAGRLGRQHSKSPFVRDLIARNWYIMANANVVYAYGNFEDDTLTTVDGGTGKTVQMCRSQPSLSSLVERRVCLR